MDFSPLDSKTSTQSGKKSTTLREKRATATALLLIGMGFFILVTVGWGLFNLGVVGGEAWLTLFHQYGFSVIPFTSLGVAFFLAILAVIVSPKD